ncbi:MAG TPA: hypothetical protein VEW70_07475, partial [Burkholderiales bacterium]|nr:hypothetical protein [Burkholderiales bacterium]
MPVNLSAPDPASLLPVPGVALGIAEANIRKPGRKDLLIIKLADGAKVAGVFTQNRFCAAPPGGNLPACAGEPFATATNDVPTPGEPRIDFVVPDDVGSDALAVFGVVCPDSEPLVEAGAFDCRGPGGRLVSLDFVLE